MSGRGRGRGGGSIGPQARDDQGNLVAEVLQGPPPLYPEIRPSTFPGKLESSERLDELRAEQSRLTRSWKNSVYNLDNANKRDKVAVVTQVERWSSRGLSAADGPGALSQFISLTPTYFPAELYSATQKRASSKAAGEQRKHLMKSAARNVELTSDEKAEEQRLNARMKLEADNERKAEGQGNEEEEEEEEDEIEDEDEDDDNDDYMQGQDYDDDDGYGDDYDDADDGDAVF